MTNVHKNYYPTHGCSILASTFQYRLIVIKYVKKLNFVVSSNSCLFPLRQMQILQLVLTALYIHILVVPTLELFNHIYFSLIVKQVLATYINHSRVRFLELTSTGVT